MKIIDCITFFDNNFMFNIRYNVLKNYVDYFVICESKYDHKGVKKKKNFVFENYFDPLKVKYLFLEKPFPQKNNPWQNQAIQREFILENLSFANDEESWVF